MSFPGEGLISGAVSGYASYKGAQKANEMNLKIAREQMGFQERMSNTAHQRAVQDMLSAGINPILAAGAGASSPGGASATMMNEMSGAVSSAIDARRASAEVANLKKQNENIASQTDLNKALTEASKVDAVLKANSATKTASDTARSWIDTLSGVGKDILPWIMLLLRRGR